MKNTLKLIKNRKKDHLAMALSPKAQVGDTGFSKYSFVHNALPEINYDEIDTSTTFFGKKVNYPFFISCMTGGVLRGEMINMNLAKAAQKFNIGMGVGSQRIAIDHPQFKRIFRVREYAPDIPILANIGIAQLNYGFGLPEFQSCVDMIDADALVIHLNPIQEVIQPEGDRNWEGLLGKLQKIVAKLSVPVIAKEVGFGLSEDVVKHLYKIGIRIFDTAGWGGTSWALVEGLRGDADRGLGELFSNWGISTTDSILECKKVQKSVKEKITILGSGGIRNGVEIAKALAMGADLVGVAAPFARAGLVSEGEVEKLIERYAIELKTTMFGVGTKNIRDLKRIKLELV